MAEYLKGFSEDPSLIAQAENLLRCLIPSLTLAAMSLIPYFAIRKSEKIGDARGVYLKPSKNKNHLQH
jgi:hypothetical protein